MTEPDVPVYDYDPRNLPGNLLEAIGLVTASFSQTDGIIEMGIAGILGIDTEFGWGVTTHMTSPLRHDVLISVAEIRFSDPHVLSELEGLAEEIQNCGKLRNRYAHGCLRIHPNGSVERETIAARGGLDVGAEPITATEARADADRIRKAGLELYKFLQRQNLLPDFPPVERARAHRTRAARKERRKLRRTGG